MTSRRVPRFYFDVREGSRFIPDRDGQDCQDIDAAEEEAAEAAAAIGRDRLPKGRDRSVAIEVRNEHTQRVITVTVMMTVVRVVPSPKPPGVELPS